MLEEQLMHHLTKDLTPYFEVFDKAIATILDQEVSKYPIFVLSKEPISIGVPLINQVKDNIVWSVNVSTLEEFAGKQLIQMDKVDDFRSIFKDPDTHYCFFIIENKEAQFVFIPKSDTVSK